MWKLLALIQKNLVWSIPVVMIAGITGGYLFDLSFLKVTVMPLTFLMVYPMMVNLQIEAVFSPKGIKPQLVAQFLNFAVIPFIAFALAKFFFPNQPLIILGMLFVALLPTSGMTISWTGFSKGNINAAVQMTVVGLILGSIATPLYAEYLMGKSIDIPMQKVFTSIVVVVFLPMIAGYLTKIFLSRIGKPEIKKRMPVLSTLGVLGIVFVAMALKAKSITSNPEVLLDYLIPLVILYAVNFTLSTVVAKLFFNRGDGIAVV